MVFGEKIVSFAHRLLGPAKRDTALLRGPGGIFGVRGEKELPRGHRHVPLCEPVPYRL